MSLAHDDSIGSSSVWCRMSNLTNSASTSTNIQPLNDIATFITSSIRTAHLQLLLYDLLCHAEHGRDEIKPWQRIITIRKLSSFSSRRFSNPSSLGDGDYDSDGGDKNVADNEPNL
jgi:hypothetical protein